MPKTYHLGIDEASANAGIALLSFDSDTGEIKYEKSYVFHPTIKLNTKSDAFILLEHQAHLKQLYLDLEKQGKTVYSTAFEGLAYAAKGFNTSKGAVWAVYALYCLGQSDSIVISPLQVKFFATGRGNADKKEMREYALDRFDLRKNYTGRTKMKFDEADALVLAEAGLWAWRIMHEGEKVAANLKDYQKEVLLTNKTNSKGKPKGICRRVDEFYMFKK